MLYLLRVEMVINSPWIMPIPGTKELASPERTALGRCHDSTKGLVSPRYADVTFYKDLTLICADLSSILVKPQSSQYIVPTGRVIVHTGRVIVPTGRYVVPTGRVIVATGRSEDSETRIHGELEKRDAEKQVRLTRHQLMLWFCFFIFMISGGDYGDKHCYGEAHKISIENVKCLGGVIYVSSFTIYFMLTIPKNNTLTGSVPDQMEFRGSSIYRVWKLIDTPYQAMWDTAYWGFLGVMTTFDIFQNILLLYCEYGVLMSPGYGVLGLQSIVVICIVQHTHLVKGLDFALLNKVRTKHTVNIELRLDPYVKTANMLAVLVEEQRKKGRKEKVDSNRQPILSMFGAGRVNEETNVDYKKEKVDSNRQSILRMMHN
uniref:RED-like N-terminal domain-containing protein n=1 Tax=Tanacetum cinerariifolium TaxID=118510 RepID=A0A6L2K0C4_TANCI|nr:hypothetical protein [Tanacetum cinerariifolium]